MPWRRSKYKSVKTVVDGITFDSKAEAARYSELKLQEKAGNIRDLVLQPVYEFIIGGRKVCSYKGDFEYERYLAVGEWELVTEDTKGFKTPVYRLKAKLFRAMVGREILETR